MVPEEKIFFWTLWCKRRLTEAVTLTIRLGATPSGLISTHLYHPPHFKPDALLAAALPLHPGLGQAQKYAGLHTHWCGCEEHTM